MEMQPITLSASVNFFNQRVILSPERKMKKMKRYFIKHKKEKEKARHEKELDAEMQLARNSILQCEQERDTMYNSKWNHLKQADCHYESAKEHIAHSRRFHLLFKEKFDCFCCGLYRESIFDSDNGRMLSVGVTHIINEFFDITWPDQVTLSLARIELYHREKEIQIIKGLESNMAKRSRLEKQQITYLERLRELRSDPEMLCMKELRMQKLHMEELRMEELRMEELELRMEKLRKLREKFRMEELRMEKLRMEAMSLAPDPPPEAPDAFQRDIDIFLPDRHCELAASIELQVLVVKEIKDEEIFEEELAQLEAMMN